MPPDTYSPAGAGGAGPRIDLHAHSTASDGTCTPAELVRAAADAGLDVVAITDHDTTDGWEPALRALPPGLTLVRGAELSCRWSDGGRPISLHLLAYLFDPADPALCAELARVRASRELRGERIVELLAPMASPWSGPRSSPVRPAALSAGRTSPPRSSGPDW